MSFFVTFTITDLYFVCCFEDSSGRRNLGKRKEDDVSVCVRVCVCFDEDESVEGNTCMM